MKGGSVLAVGAHPDDIEFMMAGTLLRLQAAGYSLHYLTLANGACGSAKKSATATARIRRKEAQTAARLLGATYHPPLVNDLEIFYADRLLRQVGAVIRTVRPALILTHALADYMEDHMNTARLVVTAAFARGMKNYRTLPSRPAFTGDVGVYHALPHGLADPLGRPVRADGFVDVTSLYPRKEAALAAHRSQQSWLDVSQKMSSYLQTMAATTRAVGKMSHAFRLAEGWCRHNPLGFGPPGADPLRLALGAHYRINPASPIGKREPVS